eukprot:INCI12807.1.p1 GENE.INCI12807.1~~INCI12807.1.p1  ORF type:complete len:530 (-),score=106.87 INCI12807.1:641-2230(-)
MAEFPCLGLLTGISFQSGVDYYNGVNNQFHSHVQKRHVIKPNPNITMVSVDCDEYCRMLDAGDWNGTVEYLMRGVDKIVAAGGCDILAIASNTGHIAHAAIEARHPSVRTLHIADCTAAAIKDRGLRKVGLLGTKATLTQPYLVDRLAAHGIECIKPEHEADLDGIFNCIKYELGFGEFKDTTREYFLGQIQKLVTRGAQGIILGCTEIELLIREEHCPDTPIFPSAELHIATIAKVLAGVVDQQTVLPKPGESVAERQAARAAEAAAAAKAAADVAAAEAEAAAKARSPKRSAHGSSSGGGKSSISFGNYGQDPSAFVSSNQFASGSNQNAGNFITNRSTTRIHAAPGGASSIVFGDDGSKPQSSAARNSPNRTGNKSSIAFGANNMPADSAPRRVNNNSRSSIQFGASDPVDEGTVSSNRFATGSNQNAGNFITGRSSTRVHGPPGGKTSISFGMSDAEATRAEQAAASVGRGTADPSMRVAGGKAASDSPVKEAHQRNTPDTHNKSSLSLGFGGDGVRLSTVPFAT